MDGEPDAAWSPSEEALLGRGGYYCLYEMVAGWDVAVAAADVAAVAVADVADAAAAVGRRGAHHPGLETLGSPHHLLVHFGGQRNPDGACSVDPRHRASASLLEYPTHRNSF